MRPTRIIVILVALAMALVAIPGTAVATHNSVGQYIEIVQADEVRAGEGVPSDDRGEILPDIGPNSPYNLDFHENLEDGDPALPARPAPPDQSGERYRDGCDEWGDAEGDSSAEQAWMDGLETGASCYVGFIDQQLEYTFFTSLLLIEQSDFLYPANPNMDDGHCRGSEDTQNRSVSTPTVENQSVSADVPILVGEDSAVDQTITRAFRATTDRCDGAGEDTMFVPGKIDIDADLFEAPVTAAHDASGTDPGSGTWMLGQAGDTYTYLFGQPHPDTPTDERSGLAAGSGPFGPNPAELGSPIADITGACGDRTKDCALLSPRDIINYDDNFPREPDSARVCYYLPQYQFAPAGGSGTANRGQNKCGNWGERADSYVGVTEAGGFGATDAPTFIKTLPGWTWGVIYLQLQSYDGYVGTINTTGFADDYLDDKKGFREGFITYVAVNPSVPARQDDLRCVTPNLLTEGSDTLTDVDGNVLTDANGDPFSDPGVYGTYVADAIDTDIYPVGFRSQLVTARDATHDEVRPTIAAVQEATDDPLSGAEELLPVDIPDIQGTEVDYTESSDPEPHAEYNENDYTDTSGDDINDSTVTDTANQAPFANQRAAGLSCNAAGQLAFNEENVFQGGGMQFDVNVQQATTNLKDPTLGITPEDESDAGAWQTDVYTFGGSAHAVLDINNNSQFDACPGSNLDPGEDVCPWEALWDAYNSNCDNNAQVLCGDLLERNGYNTSRGVGLVANLTVTGPVVVGPEAVNGGTSLEPGKAAANTHVLGVEDTTAQNCVIGTSTGFAPKLAKLVGTDTGDSDDSFDAEDARAFCPNQFGENGDGEWVLLEDAFDDQSASTPGTFGADIEWYKLLPTPAAAQEDMGFGASDQLCTTGVWNVEDLADDGTLGNTTETGDENGIADDTEADPDSPGQENIVLRFDETTPADLSTTPFDDSLNGLHTFSDCDFFDTTGEPEQ